MSRSLPTFTSGRTDHRPRSGANVVRRGLAAVAVLAVTGAVVAPSGHDTAVAATATPAATVALGGGAFGSTVALSTASLSSGKTSYLTMCTTSTAVRRASDTARVDLGVVGSIGAVTTSIRTAKSGTTSRPTVTSTTSSTTAATDLLGGLVHVSAITATAKASTTAGKTTLTGTTVLTGLRIAGLPRSASAAPNSVISLPAGLGSVTLNRQTTTRRDGSNSVSVTGMMIKVLPGNPLGLPSGTIQIGQATANAHDPTIFRSYGSAYGTSLKVGSVLKSGATAATTLPCGGSAGVTRTNHVASASVPGALSVGAVSTSSQSSRRGSTASVLSRSEIGATSLLGGVVKVSAVTASARAVRTGSTVDRTSGTKLVGLTVNGHALSVAAKENTKIDIAGVGTLYLRRAIRTSTGVEVHALELRLDVARTGLPVGTVLVVGSARAGVTR